MYMRHAIDCEWAPLWGNVEIDVLDESSVPGHVVEIELFSLHLKGKLEGAEWFGRLHWVYVPTLLDHVGAELEKPFGQWDVVGNGGMANPDWVAYHSNNMES